MATKFNFGMIRPSTILRIAEDGIGSAGTGIKNFVHRTKNEMAARQRAKLQLAVEQAERDMANMSSAQRKQFQREQREINARAAQLVAERKTPRYYKRREGIASRKAPRTK